MRFLPDSVTNVTSSAERRPLFAKLALDPLRRAA